jgi:hypothetical protein
MFLDGLRDALRYWKTALHSHPSSCLMNQIFKQQILSSPTLGAIHKLSWPTSSIRLEEHYGGKVKTVVFGGEDAPVTAPVFVSAPAGDHRLP